MLANMFLTNHLQFISKLDVYLVMWLTFGQLGPFPGVSESCWPGEYFRESQGHGQRQSSSFAAHLLWDEGQWSSQSTKTCDYSIVRLTEIYR